jgi:FdhD protein
LPSAERRHISTNVGQVRFQEFVSPETRNDPSLAQQDDPIGKVQRLVHVVRYQQYRRSQPLEDTDKHILHLCSGERIKSAKRLIHQQNRGPCSKRPGKSNPLPLSPGKLMRISRRENIRIKTHQTKQLLHSLHSLLSPHAFRFENDPNIALNCEVRKQPRLLNHVSHPAAKLDDIISLRDQGNEDLSLCGLNHPVCGAEQRGLSRTAAPQNRSHRPFLNRKGDIREQMSAACHRNCYVSKFKGSTHRRQLVGQLTTSDSNAFRQITYAAAQTSKSRAPDAGSCSPARRPSVSTDLRMPELQRNNSCSFTNVDRFDGISSLPRQEILASEEPLEIRIEFGPSSHRVNRPISVTMRTPGHDSELAAGFLFTEGVVRDPADVLTVSPDNQRIQSNSVCLKLAPEVQVNTASLSRNFYTTSSCGICGKASLAALQTLCPPRTSNTFEIEAETIYRLPNALRSRQDVFQQTGGLHAAALFDPSGTLEDLREDIGRHNALDKLIGSAFLYDRIPLHNRLLLLSGRASFELLQKSLMAGIPMIAAVGAPSSLAVRVAREFDITLIGFLRPDHFNVYNGAHRIRASQHVFAI